MNLHLLPSLRNLLLVILICISCSTILMQARILQTSFSKMLIHENFRLLPSSTAASSSQYKEDATKNSLSESSKKAKVTNQMASSKRHSNLSNLQYKSESSYRPTKNNDTLKINNIHNSVTIRTSTATSRSQNYYSQQDIMQVASTTRIEPARILMFHGENGTFATYSIDNAGIGSTTLLPQRCFRCSKTIPLIVDSLYRHRPERFQRGQPSFQLLFTVSDYTISDCMNSQTTLLNDNVHCSHESNNATKVSTAPWIQFGSVLKNQSLLPNVMAFPNFNYIDCIWEWRVLADGGNNENKFGSCVWQNQLFASNNAPWEQLVPQIIWRGSDFRFLHRLEPFNQLRHDSGLLTLAKQGGASGRASLMAEWDRLPPRWRGIVLSLQALSDVLEGKTKRKLPWIDCKFASAQKRKGKEQGKGMNKNTTSNFDIREEYMDAKDMATYRYQIDFGGGGGTSWKGTLSKLAMPGVLLHHETPTKDWYYNEMKPWVHYIPIRWDLNDLKEKFEWAESNPLEAMKISQQGTQFALYILSKHKVHRSYDTYFRDKLVKEVVDRYIPAANETSDLIMHKYYSKGMKLHQVSDCNNKVCWVKVGKIEKFNLPLYLLNVVGKQRNDTHLIEKIRPRSEKDRKNDVDYSNYRLADIVKLKYGVNTPIIKTLGKYHVLQRTVTTEWPETLAELYLQEVGQFQYAFRNITALKKAINRWVTSDQSNELRSPTKKELVVHLRLGDTLTHPALTDLSKSVNDLWQNGTFKARTNRILYNYNKDQFMKLLHDVPKDITAAVIVGSDVHANRQDNTHRNKEYKSLVASLLKSRGFAVSFYEHNNPDRDFVFMANATWFLGAMGGYSNLAARCVTSGGGRVFYRAFDSTATA